MKFRRLQLTRALGFTIILTTGLIATAPRELSARQTTSLPLAQQGDMVYLGAFRLPAGTTDQTSFDYGGTALAFNSQRGSLFIVGHDWYQRVAEVSIPAVVNSSTLSGLATASLIQPLTDVLKGRIGAVGSGTAKIGGLLPYGNQLIVSAYLYYDGNGTQTLSHFVTSADVSSTSAPAGPYVVSNSLGLAGFVSGYMTPIPAEWQSALGGPYMTGQCCIPIIGRTSSGPSVTVFDPTTLGATAAPGKTVLGYPLQSPMIGNWNSSGTLFNGSTQMGGVVFAPGTRSLLFFGRRGTGPFCYGEGTATQSLAGTVDPGDGSTYCYDPTDSSKGTHSYPYVHSVWAYDVNDLVAVKQGLKQPWAVQPYASWTLDTPFETGSRIISGVAYDPATQRVFISAAYENGASPLIQVFKLNAGSGAAYVNPVTPLNPTTPTTPTDPGTTTPQPGHGTTPTDPAPAPTEPTPTQPAPTNPTPTDPTPTPTSPTPTQPAPTPTDPTTPTTPTQPVPSIPVPNGPSRTTMPGHKGTAGPVQGCKNNGNCATSTTVAVVSGAGTVQQIGSLWVIVQGSTTYVPSSDLSQSMQRAGLKVSFSGVQRPDLVSSIAGAEAIDITSIKR